MRRKERQINPQAQNQAEADRSRPERRSVDENTEDVIAAMSAVFVKDGADDETAWFSAAALVETYGSNACRRQLDWFPRRCELARASAQGLKNASGLLVSSIRGRWSPPSQQAVFKEKKWYNDDEAGLILT